MLNGNIEMTEKAAELYKLGSDGIESVAKGESPICMSEILSMAGKTQGLSPQSLYVLTQAIAEREENDHKFQAVGVVDTYMRFAVHRGGQVKEGEKGFPVLLDQKDEDGNTIKLKPGTYFELTQVKDWQATPTEPSEESLNPHGTDDEAYAEFDKAWDKACDILDRHKEDSPVIAQMAQHIAEQHFGIRIRGVIDPYENGWAYIDRLDADIVNACKDKSQHEILSMVQTALDDSAEAISILTEFAEQEIENSVMQRAEIFGVPVLFEEADSLPGKYDSVADRPMNMFVYELFDKDGESYIAHAAPRDGDFKGYVFAADAIPGGYEGLCVGDTFNVIGHEAVYKFRQEYENSPVSKTGFYHNNEILVNNEDKVMCKPNKNLRVYGVYDDHDRLVGAGYLDKADMPRTNREVLEFADKHDIPERGISIIFNCEGEMFGVALDKEVLANESTRSVTQQATIFPDSYIKFFAEKHGGIKDVNVRERGSANSVWYSVGKMEDKADRDSRNVHAPEKAKTKSGPSRDD